jgi:hypothetical protein
MGFIPTHIITFPNGEKTKLMLVGEFAYDASQWRESACADYQVKNGKWTFKGEPVSGTVEEAEEEPVNYIDILK